jgi:hypothetical protein
MQSTKLSDYLKVLTPQEFKALGKFVKSPYFNESKRMILTYEGLKKIIGKFDFENKTSEEIFANIFPEEKADIQSKRKIIYEFAKIVESFFTYAEIEKDGLLLSEKLNNFLKKRESLRLYREELQKSYSKLLNSDIKSADLLYKQFEFELEKYFNQSSKETQINQEEKIDRISQELEMCFMVNKLRIICAYYQNYPGIKKPDFYKAALNEVKVYVDKNKERIIKDFPVLYAYYLTTFVFFNPSSSKGINEAINFLLQNEKYITDADLEYLVKTLFYVSIESGNDNEALSLCRKISENEIILRFSIIDHSLFINIIDLSINKGDIEFSGEFLRQYSPKLNTYLRANTVRLSMGMLKFAQKDFNAALQYLNDIKFSDYHFYIFSKIILIKIQIETKDYLRADSESEAMKQYIYRHKSEIPDILQKKAVRFIYYIKLITADNNEPDKNSYLAHEISNEKYLFQKSWLLKKLSNI